MREGKEGRTNTRTDRVEIDSGIKMVGGDKVRWEA